MAVLSPGGELISLWVLFSHFTQVCNFVIVIFLFDMLVALNWIDLINDYLAHNSFYVFLLRLILITDIVNRPCMVAVVVVIARFVIVWMWISQTTMVQSQFVLFNFCCVNVVLTSNNGRISLCFISAVMWMIHQWICIHVHGFQKTCWTSCPPTPLHTTMLN
jgi:hypothetical protein